MSRTVKLTKLPRMATRQQVPTEVLLPALERVLSQHFGTPRRIAKLHRRDSLYSSSCALENLELELDRGRRLSLVFKDLSPAALLEAAREVRPGFLYDPSREIETYRRILETARFGTPIFYGAVTRPKLQRYWLFLERIEGPLLWQVGRLETWRQAARWLAMLHSEFAGVCRERSTASLSHLLRYDRQFLGLWRARAEEFFCGKSSAGSGRLCRTFLRLTDRYDGVIDRLMTLPKTVIHGEFYPSNVIVPRDANEKRLVCPIDWELASVAPGLIDLAALTLGAWSAEQRQSLIAAYRDALEPAAGWPPSLPELIEAVEYCQLHISVQWLGWASDWAPPKIHAQDWLGEAVRLANRLGI